MFPLAVAAGNTFVMKPSEKCPGAAMLLASMAKEAGLPDGEVVKRIQSSFIASFFLSNLMCCSYGVAIVLKLTICFFIALGFFKMQ